MGDVRNRLQVLMPGSTVKLTALISGKVLQACIRVGGVIQYQVAWWDDARRVDDWFYDFELYNENDQPKKGTIILSGKESVKVGS